MKESLEARVARAAEAALSRQSYVSMVDVLVGMGLLSPNTENAWRHGRIEFLEGSIQGSPEKIARSISLFREWAQVKGLEPSEARYTRAARGGSVELRFGAACDPAIEKLYLTRYISPALSGRRREAVEQRLSKADPVVFDILRESQCSECGAELEKGGFLFMDAEKPLCLACAGLDDLEYLPAGDATLTRRASKYSGRKAVVVRFSRSRGRYERQGILLESPAIEKAEQECTEDADQRAKARQRAAVQRAEEDRELVARMAAQIASQFPACPPGEARAIAEHTAKRGSGRIGRTAAGRKLEEQALTLAVAAAVRHQHTNYDALLAGGMDRTLARERVADQMQGILANWSARK